MVRYYALEKKNIALPFDSKVLNGAEYGPVPLQYFSAYQFTAALQ